jgi:hypothetical protein
MDLSERWPPPFPLFFPSHFRSSEGEGCAGSCCLWDHGARKSSNLPVRSPFCETSPLSPLFVTMDPSGGTSSFSLLLPAHSVRRKGKGEPYTMHPSMVEIMAPDELQTGNSSEAPAPCTGSRRRVYWRPSSYS